MTGSERLLAAHFALVKVRTAREAIESAITKLRELCTEIGINPPVAGTLAEVQTAARKAESQLEALLGRIPLSPRKS